MPPELRSELQVILPMGALAIAALYSLSRAKPQFFTLDDAPKRSRNIRLRELGIALCGWFIGFLGLLLLSALVGTVSGLAQTPLIPSTQPKPAPFHISDGQLLFLSVVGQLLLNTIPIGVLIASSGFSRPGLILRGILPRKPLRDAFFGLGGFLIVTPLVFATVILMQVVGFYLFNQSPDVNEHPILEGLRKGDSPLLPGGYILSASIIAPMVEETVFRGLIQTGVLNLSGRVRRSRVLLISAVLFTSIHLGGGQPWEAIAGIFVLALALGWLYEKTGSLWPGIILHSLFNSLNVALVLFSSPAP